MVVCSFYQQGRCKFGDRCKYEHPGQQTLGSGNRFGALSGGGGFGGRASSAQSQQPANYGVTADDIKLDLTAGKGRPEWIFSCYGPGRNAPRQLFGGPQREQSFEELRLRHYEATATGNMNQAVQEAQTSYAEALQQIEVVLSDLNGAVKYVLDGANEHPNRIDITEGKTGPFRQPSAFGAPPASLQPPKFGLPAGMAPRPAFGRPAGLGQPAFGQTSFGQPSALGQGSSFGQPSALGQGSAFGKPSGLGAQNAFGKPAFGQSGFGQPAFGQPSSLGAAPFGQPSTTASPFSQIPSQNQGTCGGVIQPTVTPFSQAAGQPQQQQQQQPSGFGQQSAAPTSGFGAPSQTTNTFGQQQQGALNPFGQPTQAPSPFGAAAQQPTPSPFATGSAAPQPAPAAGIGPPPLLKIEDPNDLSPLPPLSGQTMRDPMTKKLTAWKGQPVKYIDNAPCYLHPQDRKTFVRIFFPDGPPDGASLRDAQAKPEEYTPEVTEQFEFFVKNGYFKDGIVPSVPPKTEWVSFDF